MRADPDVLGVVNTILSIAISIIDLANQFSHESRSVASDGLTKCIQAMVSLNIYKNSANEFGRKRGYKIEKEIEDQDQPIPKSTGILT